jgi:hypothetical protein
MNIISAASVRSYYVQLVQNSDANSNVGAVVTTQNL